MRGRLNAMRQDGDSSEKEGETGLELQSEAVLQVVSRNGIVLRLLKARPMSHRTWKISMSSGNSNVIRILLAILLPPLGVFLEVGLGIHFWINLLLTFFGYIPGIIHAVWIILQDD